MNNLKAIVIITGISLLLIPNHGLCPQPYVKTMLFSKTHIQQGTAIKCIFKPFSVIKKGFPKSLKDIDHLYNIDNTS